MTEVLEELSLFPDRSERIEALIALAEEYINPPQEALARTEDSKVPGCESEVFFLCKIEADKMVYRFAVDNPQGISAMALAVILEKASPVNPADAIEIRDDIVLTVFGRELSMGKSLGLNNMVRKLKDCARGFLSSEVDV